MDKVQKHNRSILTHHRQNPTEIIYSFLHCWRLSTYYLL